MKKNILVVVTLFYPDNLIGAIRNTKIVKFLSILGYSITVVTPTPQDKIVDETLYFDNYKKIRHLVVPHGAIFTSLFKSRRDSYKSKETTEVKRKIRRYSKFESLPGEVYTILKDIDWKRQVLKNTQLNQLLLSEKFDVLITGSPSHSTQSIGRALVKSGYINHWIADFRDPVVDSCMILPFNKWYTKRFARNVCKHAHAISAVSIGCLNNLFFDSHPNKHIITNGFDRDDIKNIDIISPKKFTLSYLGTLYSGRRDLTPLFKVIHELIAEKKIDGTDITIRYAGSSKVDFVHQATSYALEHIIEAVDSVPRIESLKTQLESHLLILASWNNVGDEGVVTGKFLEYMMINRPVVALVAGNLKNSVVKNMMKESNLGICYEEANRKEDENTLKDYILNQYNLYKQKKSLDFHPHKEYVEQFTYENITKQFIELFTPSEHKGM